MSGVEVSIEVYVLKILINGLLIVMMLNLCLFYL